jgi:hypothetical protein
MLLFAQIVNDRRLRQRVLLFAAHVTAIAPECINVHRSKQHLVSTIIHSRTLPNTMKTLLHEVKKIAVAERNFFRSVGQIPSKYGGHKNVS